MFTFSDLATLAGWELWFRTGPAKRNQMPSSPSVSLSGSHSSVSR